MKHLSYKKGFTLIETMVAISILMLGITGPLMLVASSLRNALFARDNITAYYLAQEGIEFVRYVRDDNYILRRDGDTGRDWLEGLDLCATANGCAIDTVQWFLNGYGDPLPIEACNVGCTTPQMYITSAGSISAGYYTYDSTGNSAAKYRRAITIEPVGTSENEVEVVSTITWTDGALGTKTFSVSEHLFNIYQNL